MNGVSRQPRGPPFDMNGRDSPTWGPRRRFSSEGGEFYREDGPDFSYSEYSEEGNNNKHTEVFIPREESIYVTHVESPTTFWAQSADAATVEAIQQFSADMQIYCQNKPVLQNPPFQKKIYGGIYNEDNEWYRCTVISQDTQKQQVQVRFVDFGNTEEITKRDMVCLSMAMINQKPYAQRYSLEGVQNTVSTPQRFSEAVEHLDTLTAGKLLKATTKRHRSSMLEAVPVDLFDPEGGVNINVDVLNRGIATPAAAIGRVSPPITKAPLSPIITTPSAATGRVSPPTTNAPLSPIIAKQVPSSPQAVSTPRVEARPDPELLQLRETVKNQQNQIRSQRQLNFQLKEKHREELSSLQGQQQHVLTNKFNELMSKVNTIRKLRHDASTGEESAVIFEAVNQLRSINEMEELIKVKDAELKLEGKQNDIRICVDKSHLTSLVEERNTFREELLSDITKFCNHMSDVKLDECLTNLKDVKNALQSCAESAGITVDTIDVSGNCMDIVKEYEEWMEICKLDLEEVRNRCDHQHKKFTRVYNTLLESVNLDASEEKSIPEDLDTVLQDFVAVIDEEISVFKRTDQEKAKQLKSRVLAVLLAETSKEIKEEQLRCYLQHFKALKDQSEESVSNKPDVAKVMATRKTIRSLKSKIGHKLIDREDLKERDDVDYDELKQCEDELSSAYSELHAAFTEEQKLVAYLADLSCIHFPELPLQHPELSIKGWLATHGLLASGRLLDHYAHDRVEVKSACRIFNTQFAGEECLLKEYRLLDDTSKELFQQQAVEYHTVHSTGLIKLQALFYGKQNVNAYLQVPSYMAVAEWRATTPTLKEMGLVMKGVLEGLQELHAAGLVHGGITQDAVLVGMADDVASGVLDHYDFSKSLAERVYATATQLGFDTTICRPSAQMDMLCYGTVFAKTLFPELNSISDFILCTEDAGVIALVEGLTTADDASRLTAERALAMEFFQETPSTALE